MNSILYMQYDYMYSKWLLRLITLILPPGIWAWWALTTGGIEQISEINAFHFILLGLAAFRITRLFTLDVITEFIRGPFVKERSYRTPEGVFKVDQEARDESPLREHIGELISCYWCAGIWISLGLVFAYFYIPSAIFLPFLLLLGIAGIQALLEGLARFMSQGLRWFNRIPDGTGPQQKPKHHQAE